jgi:PAS domain S-box-containing protein
VKFGHLSIRRKVALVTMLIPGSTIVLAASGWYILQQATIERLAESELNKLADLVSLGVNDAVMGFQPSPADAERALDVLRNKSEVDEAHIFTVPDLKRFASTPAAARPPADLAALGLGFHPDEHGLWLVREMTDDRGRVFGRAALHSTLAALQLERRRSLEWLGLVALGIFAAAYWASRMFTRSLSRPLGELHSAMELIEARPNESRRVPDLGPDEIGHLAARINQMLIALEEQSAALRASEERTRVLVATAPAAIVVFDLESGRFVEVNDYACVLFRLSRAELCRRGPVDLSPALQPNGQASAAFGPAMIARAVSGEKPRFEWVHCDADGREIHCDVALVRLVSVERTLVCGILVDITERKQAEERLRKSQAGLEEAQELAGIGSWERLVGATRAEWSREMFRLHGLDPVEGPPDVAKLLSLVHPEDRDEMNRIYREVLSGGISEDLHYRTSPETGRIRHIRVRFAQVRDATGRVLKVRGTCMDVTAQREVEEQRRQLESQMRQAQKLEALGTLAGGIAHDFNNILTAILGNVELARMDPADAPAVQQCLEGIDRVGRRARDLVQRILAFSRQQEQTLSHIELQPVVEEVFKLLRSTIPANITLEMQAASRVPAVMGDASQIHQVVMNLATNAWHALDQHSGRIRFGLEPVQVDSRLSQTSPDLHAGPYVRLDIKDDGMGMSPATMERIFEPFYTTKAPGRGTGLGLSVVHGIMKSHGGAVTVESAVGRGSTFHLYFPAVEGTEPAAVEVAPLTVAPGRGQHVLYVDDEEALVNVGTRMLKKMGYHATGFTQAADALEAFQAEPGRFQLLVTDMSMPGMSGLELARQILKIRPDFPIVLSSGYLKEDEMQQARAAGVREIVVKPTVVDQLAQILHRLLA